MIVPFWRGLWWGWFYIRKNPEIYSQIEILYGFNHCSWKYLVIWAANEATNFVWTNHMFIGSVGDVAALYKPWVFLGSTNYFIRFYHEGQLNWLVVPIPLKNISQLGWLFPTYGEIKTVPTHQPVKKKIAMNYKLGISPSKIEVFVGDHPISGTFAASLGGS